MFVVTVKFTIQPAFMPAFMPLMVKNAQQSLEVEAECHQFDVCKNETDPNAVFLYEVYTNRDAFDVHLKSKHFLDFDQAVANMVADKQVTFYEMVTS